MFKSEDKIKETEKTNSERVIGSHEAVHLSEGESISDNCIDSQRIKEMDRHFKDSGRVISPREAL